ncbi:MarR family transcriptional regulator [Halobiforma lacisalsi AJ5]|uniref:MarR family transcriptional regulator n=1 Tax=Natronobacterium lacisalsi AJ5 TaxID=358396 RepID=M0L5E9_NATLA|nr:MarR family transcriptional regulator [Halobiforma lacisalsi AJ5]EMA27215.1 hypothetical protein C445_20981 [Halobiforma lacisalsi AJ5]
MPISKDRFEEIRNEENGGVGSVRGTDPAKILNFLREHADKAFTQDENAKWTDAKQTTVQLTLVRLWERGRVDHHGNYWRISDHDQSVDAATGHAGTTLAAHEDDDETPWRRDWNEIAVDPREHRSER